MAADIKKHATRNAVIVITILVGLGIAGYLIYNNVSGNGTPSKSDMVLGILQGSGGTGNYDSLMSFDTGYITAWYNAIQNKSANFVISGKTFDSVTGKQIS